MKLKKLLCLMLAVLMVCSMTACGEPDDGAETNKGNQGGDNPEVTTAPTEPSAEDLGPWVVTEEMDYLGSIYRYHYDENGELTSYELYDENNKKLRDYRAAHTATESGGKLTVIESKHVKDSEYAKTSEMEYDADGNLIRISSFAGSMVTYTYLYTYDADGNLLTYEKVYEEKVVERAQYTYVDGVLATASGKQFFGEDSYHYDYTYTYSDNGYLSEIGFARSDVGEGTITLGKDISKTEGGLHVITHSAHSMAYQNLFAYEAELDADGQRGKFTIRFRRWGFEPFFALPLPGFGSMLTGWEECDGQITYTRLDVYLAEQAANQ